MLFYIEAIRDDFTWDILGYYATTEHRFPKLYQRPWYDHIFIPYHKLADMFEDHELVLCSY